MRWAKRRRKPSGTDSCLKKHQLIAPQKSRKNKLYGLMAGDMREAKYAG